MSDSGLNLPSELSSDLELHTTWSGTVHMSKPPTWHERGGVSSHVLITPYPQITGGAILTPGFEDDATLHAIDTVPGTKD
jgi:hypothetical protein